MKEFTDLVLLIGTSPLPNYVVAKYFVESNKMLERIWFIHSDEGVNQSSTRRYAENIQTLLLNKCENISKETFRYIPIKNIENMREIENSLKNLMPFNINSKVHLNFTGGTKVMVVQAYQFINNSEDIEEKSFSYLSSRTFDLRDGNQNVICKDLRPLVVTSIEEMIALHNYVRVNHPEKYNFSESNSLFSKLIRFNSLNSYFNPKKAWNREIFLTKKRNFVLLEDKVRMSEIVKNKPESEPFLDIVQAMPKELRIYDKNGEFLKPQNNKYFHDALCYLDGKWLEEYLYLTLKANTAVSSNFTIDKNWEIKHPSWQNNKFEIDVILIKGYQLVGISCTTLGDNFKAAIKNKGFEIILRSRQIAGDEAKAILITMVDDALRDVVKAELQTETGSKENILVLGRNDLEESKLMLKIKAFIN